MVPMTETASEPRQPTLFEKNANIAHPSHLRRSLDLREPGLLRFTDETVHYSRVPFYRDAPDPCR